MQRIIVAVGEQSENRIRGSMSFLVILGAIYHLHFKETGSNQMPSAKVVILSELYGRLRYCPDCDDRRLEERLYWCFNRPSCRRACW